MTKHMLLIEDRNGDTAAVGPFPTQRDAREWEDAHEDVIVVGCVPVYSKREALSA